MRSYKAKMVEPITLPSRERREEVLAEAGYNAFNIPAENVYVDLLTDSGTGTMSDAQWAALFRGDESYAGSESFHRLREAVEDVTGFSRVIPTHQGRGAENVLYGCLVEEGDVVLNNAHFDTTRAHIANQGGDPVDCPVEGARDPVRDAPFKGNFSADRARDVVDDVGAERVPVVVLTITNNSTAGQPVSAANVRETAAFAEEIDATFVIDACRFAENAHFVRRREEGYEDRTVADIAREQLSHADAIVMSGKKEALVNIGGFVAVRDADLFERAKQRAILYEGFPTYGGMSGRDIEAMAVGLREAVEPPYVEDRVEQVEELGRMLEERGVPIYRPVGGHAVYVDAGELLSHLPSEQFPGQALVCELYREGGVRGVELGSFAFPGADRLELVRLAIPRRTYGREHLEHVADAAAAVGERAPEVTGLEVVSEPPTPELRHFSAELAPV
ncbi:tryptophanase [Halegenticoccus tardaugens]|uniref:tryptophanase n=1 Tax=Halegenticoccus tardaugens TaxID=2071624 RepID=UPI00100C1F72|nr:tryptophanase [Halegenticoccus tardaugens]